MLDMISAKYDGSFFGNWCRSWRIVSAAADPQAALAETVAEKELFCKTLQLSDR